MTPSVVVMGLQETVLSGSMLLALPLAVAAGIVSFASPCVLPLVPGYVGFVTGLAGGLAGSDAGPRVPSRAGPPVSTGGLTVAPSAPPRPSRGRLVAGASLFVAGFTAVFVLLGVVAGSVGAALLATSDVVTRVLGLLVVLLGLTFAGWLPFGTREWRFHVAPTAGLWGAPLLGVVFGLGWAPCIGPTLVAVYTLALDTASAGRGAVLSIAYSIGLGVPFLLVALGAGGSRRAVAFLRRHRVAVMRTGGSLLVLIGLALVTGVWGTVTGAMQGWIGGFTTVL
jgi:cytochrome c-type biogenesis protein